MSIKKTNLKQDFCFWLTFTPNHYFKRASLFLSMSSWQVVSGLLAAHAFCCCCLYRSTWSNVGGLKLENQQCPLAWYSGTIEMTMQAELLTKQPCQITWILTFWIKTTEWIWSKMGKWGSKRERIFTNYPTSTVLEEGFSKSILMTFLLDNSQELSCALQHPWPLPTTCQQNSPI